MKRRSLCNTKKVVAVILAASMTMSSGITAFAEDIEVKAEAVKKDEKVVEDSNDGDITAISSDFDSSNSEAWQINDAEVSVHVKGNENGDVDAQSSSILKEATTTVTIDGNVSSSDDDNESAIEASSRGSKATTNVTVEGNVSSDYDAVKAGSSDDGKVTGSSATNVTIKGDVSSKDRVSVYGYSDTYNDYDHSQTNGTAKTNVTVNGSISATSSSDTYGEAYGVSSGANGIGATTEITVGKGITVDVKKDSKGTGISAKDKEGGTSNVSVNGDVKVNAEWQGTGISMDNFDYSKNGNGNTNVDIGGNVIVNVVGRDDDIQYGDGFEPSAYGFYGNNVENASVTVGGDLEATSVDKANGLLLNNATGIVDIDIGGNVIQNGNEGTAIGIIDTKFLEEDVEAPKITVKVAKDVTATNTALEIKKNLENSSIDITVEGTVKGAEHSIFVGDTTNTENLSITVWKVDTSNDKPIVETITDYIENEGIPKAVYGTNEVTRKIEENINYIIRIEPVETEGGNLVADKKTAHAGEDVYLEVTIPEGYTIESFYSATDATKVDVIASGGKYYLKVPSGGGVDVGVKLKKIENSNGSGSGSYESGSGDSSSSDDDWTVTNTQIVNKGVFSPTAFAGLTFQAIGADGTPLILNVLDVLTPLEPVSAFNNFTLGRPTYGLNNVLGAAVVDFNDLLATTLGDIVNIPVAANVTAGNNYTVYFSDGTSTTVQCTTDGILTIPFNKNTKGLTYMIYGAQSNPLMGLPSIDTVEPIQQIGIGENAFKSADLNFGFESPTGLKQIGYDTFAESTELHPQLIGNDGQR